MQKLYTDEGLNLPDIPWNRYPRPQLERAEWLCLNGKWSFYSEKTRKREILVPFCPESLLSGILNPPEPGTEMIYEREFYIPESWRGSRVLLHFGAVSRECRVSVNDREVCRHDNAYLPFSADITEALEDGRNLLRVRVLNDLSTQYPRGKQTRNRGGMWYTPVSGIWQTVWLEPVPEQYIQGISISTGTDCAEVKINGLTDGYVLFEGERIPIKKGRARIEVSDPKLWSPECPNLYFFEVRCGEDRIKSYFALRVLTIQNVNGADRLCLNGKAYFFNGLLDQGYWSDGLYTPAGPEAYEKDILTMKSLGYNTLRKHIKIEPEQFYYDCDRLGMIVFQDMVNNGDYHYLRDTVLPTIGVTGITDARLNRDPQTRTIFLQALDDTVRLLSNHPSICLWTIFNEGWGQFCADEAYERLKALDASRFIDSTSGWFHQKKSDVDSLHIYFKKLRPGTEAKPQVLSEFGGYTYKIPEHSFNLKKTYGYKKYKERDAFIKGLLTLYQEVYQLAKEGLSGAIYTQLSDVEDETNGLFTFDRKVLKVQPQEIKLLMDRICHAAEEKTEYWAGKKNIGHCKGNNESRQG